MVGASSEVALGPERLARRCLEMDLTASGARAPDAPYGCSPIPAGSLAVAPPDSALHIANKLSMSGRKCPAVFGGVDTPA